METPVRILLLEDSPIDAELTQARLQRSDIPCVFELADSQASFQGLFSTQPFDLVLADYSLPDFDGLSALKMVRAHDGDLPFIFVSGVLGEDVAVDTLLLGATDYVIKQKLDRLVPSVKRALAEHSERLRRRHAEDELRSVERRFQGLTDSLPAMVWTCNPQGQLTFVNSRWMECVGPAHSWPDLAYLHPDDLPACVRGWAEASTSGSTFELEARFKVRDKVNYRWQLVRAVPLHNSEGAVIEWVCTCMDAEDQKRRDFDLKTAEKLALTGRMAAVIAHEINNPLEAVTNLLYLLRGEAPRDAEEEGYFTLMEQELLRISAITKQTLLWSREEAQHATISAANLIGETVRLFSTRIKSRAITLDLSGVDDVQLEVIVGEIRQVLANLLSNAIDAVPNGGEVHISAGGKLDENGAAVVEVCIADNGPGISQERLEDLFRPFQSTKGVVGNGLGLYVSKEIVDRHKGQLLVDSAPGQGTTMTIVLPVPRQGSKQPVTHLSSEIHELQLQAFRES